MFRIILFGLVMLMSGCSYLTGPGDYSHYATALQAHSESESARITGQSQAIVDLANESVKSPRHQPRQRSKRLLLPWQ